ncbi:restriction endonuclease subunit S [Corynebacterium kefirresidentii]|uniref:restriction endonuclease subunit S n=1 Tax=Corynebacterium kefirresidentii TaxID=1979527 RepID=UPI0038CF5DE0
MKKIVSLKEVCASDYGVTASATEQPTGTHFLRITDIVNFTDYSGVPFVDIDDEDRRKKLLKQNDIVVARTGATVGASHLFRGTEPTVFASYLVRFRPKTSDVDPVFVSYVLNSPAWKQFISANAHSKSAQPNLSAAAMMDFQFSLPEISEQQKIASVLKALDDKLAANQRTIRDCESLSEVLFRKTSATADTTTLGKELELHYGKALPKKSRIPGKVTVVGSGGISGFHNEILLDGPSIIVGRKGTIGTVHWISGPNYPIDTTFWVESKRLPLELLYFLLKSCDFASMNTDSAVPGLNRKNAYQVAVPWISEDSASEIGPLLKTLRARQEHARKENQILARTRDELLPLLMSGRITVGEAEDAADEAASES